MDSVGFRVSLYVWTAVVRTKWTALTFPLVRKFEQQLIVPNGQRLFSCWFVSLYSSCSYQGTEFAFPLVRKFEQQLFVRNGQLLFSCWFVLLYSSCSYQMDSVCLILNAEPTEDDNTIHHVASSLIHCYSTHLSSCNNSSNVFLPQKPAIRIVTVHAFERFACVCQL